MTNLLIKRLQNQKQQLLEELWDVAAFDDTSYDTFAQTIETHFSNTDTQLPLPNLCFELSTVRNRNLITAAEQRKLKKTVVGFLGLSVGSHSALTWMMESRADTIKIADPDNLDAVNLNRLRFSWGDIGKTKVDVVKTYIAQINPFVNIVGTTNVSAESMITLFDTSPKIKLVVDAIDSMKGKILLRKLARQRHLPLISAADIGDNVMLDIERYDLDPQPELFLGRLPGIDQVNIDELSTIEKKKLIIKLVGFKNNSERMLNSLLNIGKSVSTWPQLGATATIAGGIVATSIKKIILGEKVKSGRYYLLLDNLLVSDINLEDNKKRCDKIIKKIKYELSIK
ncbi:MAG: UBA/THIF-type NAD/FAD binding protein [Candidatus Gottesmanbacteria bacterium GW2011_GWA1_34_13]|uniref:UBA/THIF-type NAD/FAD binding protein n=1 Tax=Candidatus Gottesmanbacteria bacterium GW2011_GWA1_34_13 TaxID=1618434 RepID=A0A0G0B817_9BACT|nr:MAG: UBA/THIF-type NAD/FAD binding protein [Candidatus Gottesmanbacteria bacterium GW2011_GWA1_34_13]